mmetsp:Transcript_66884/g.56795  ORF Transcript_66884/g.56795 Transcript_66884/m.56795 type:complete len:82 (+) Transcript_66884:409-654(+)
MSIASGSAHNSIKVYDSDNGNVLNTFRGHNDTVITTNYSSSGSSLVSGSLDKKIIIWDCYSTTALLLMEGHTGRVLSVSWS